MVAKTLMVGWLAGLGMAGAAAAAPARLSIEPNALVRPEQTLEILVEGVPRGEAIELAVLRDCDHDGQAEESASCPLVFSRASGQADERGVVQDRLAATVLKDFPKEERLWLRAGGTGGKKVVFSLVKDECSLFRTLVEAFTGGSCDPGLAQVLRLHRQPSGLEDLVFEVRLLTVRVEAAEPVAIRGTRGANGVGWAEKSGELLVTAAGSPAEGALAAGLYLVDPRGEAVPKLLWAPEAGQTPPAAPLGLPGGRIAFVRQVPVAQKLGAPEEVARLVIWEKGAMVSEVPLPYRAHQLLGADRESKRLLALSLGVADNRPVFMVVDLERRGVEVVGFSNALYQSVLREPGGQRSVVAFENSRGGWQIALAEGPQLVRDLVRRAGKNDLAPVWKPGGGELAYLAEVGPVP